MENNHFYVFTKEGRYLGMVTCRLGNDVFIVDHKFKDLLTYISGSSPEKVLHLDNQSNDTQNWEIVVGEHYKGRDNEFWFVITKQRDVPHERTFSHKWWHYLPGFAQLNALLHQEPN